MMIKVAKIHWLGDFRLRFVFSDNMAGDYDFSGLVAEQGPMVEPLRDPTFFKHVFLEDGAPTWPNGFDLSPSWLHREIAAAGKLHREVAV